MGKRLNAQYMHHNIMSHGTACWFHSVCSIKDITTRCDNDIIRDFINVLYIWATGTKQRAISCHQLLYKHTTCLHTNTNCCNHLYRHVHIGSLSTLHLEFTECGSYASYNAELPSLRKFVEQFIV